MSEPAVPSGPDLVAGVPIESLLNGIPLLGHAHGEPVVLVKRGADLFAVGATCTHYGGPLAEGLVVESTIRCPWHHACFDLRTGEATGAPALSDLPCFEVVSSHGARARRRKAVAPAAEALGPGAGRRSSCGAGAAGAAAVEALRREGYARTDHADRRRAARPGGSPESLEGLSGGRRAGGLDPAAS